MASRCWWGLFCIAAVRGVQQTHTYFVMEEVKSTHRLVVPEGA